MKYILCQPATNRFKWELDVCLTNLKAHGIKNIVLLFQKWDDAIPVYFKNKYGVETHVYEDSRDDKSYIPSIKPYLWWKYLEEDASREKGKYFYMDSDVIFREKLDFRKLPVKNDVWYCSDCNGYLSLDYIRQCKNGETVLREMASIVCVTVESLETINHNSGGAQWLIKNPSVEYWKKVYEDSNKIWKYFENLDSNIQKWTAEMWAQLWNMMYFNIGAKVSNEMEFCWATDPLERWHRTKIMHNAGATEKDKDLFFKGKYIDTSPFDDDLSFVNRDRVSAKYVEAVKKVEHDE
ncbi:hypothetical protein [Oceanobacillus neutriphilus]|uniref:Uncharacterized protein n=1 Tax=Oceanobacillus neutriphilus TaxID=531815 RepID=A0ABQ2P384_9BACI|nr:hypothetical protein [Oceanobacillus neutriphilus]GGP17239.1 hypothetical protein GCM10011346_52340 [Oceanobacillus neutriphilus]